MSLNPEWKIELVRSSDMASINALDYAFTLSLVYNRPGSFNMTIPLDEEVAYEISKHATGIRCTRNGVAKWSGEVITTPKNASAMTLGVTALGWLDQLNHRPVRASEEASLTFTAQTGGSIAQALVTSVNAQQDTGGTIRPTAITFGTHTDTQVRTRSYKRGQNYGQAIQELSDVDNGFDMSVDPVTRQLSTKPPTDFQDRTGVIFGYNVEPNNLADITENDDGSTTAERVTFVGGNGVIVAADDPVAIVAHGGFMRDEWLSISDVSDTIIIGAYANSELVYRRYGTKTYDFQVQPYADIPRLFDDFELGDKVYLSADAGALQLDRQAVRIFSVTIEVDTQGNEIMSQIGTAPQ